MSPPIVEARSIVKTYDTGAVRVEALRGVELTLERGDGRSWGRAAAGRRRCSTALRPRRRRRGEVVIDGTSLSEMSDRERTDYRARHMGFVFQFYNLMPVLTAVENVELPLLIARESAAPRGAARSRRSTWSGWPTARHTCPTSCRAESASA